VATRGAAGLPLAEVSVAGGQREQGPGAQECAAGSAGLQLLSGCRGGPLMGTVVGPVMGPVVGMLGMWCTAADGVANVAAVGVAGRRGRRQDAAGSDNVVDAGTAASLGGRAARPPLATLAPSRGGGGGATFTKSTSAFGRRTRLQRPCAQGVQATIAERVAAPLPIVGALVQVPAASRVAAQLPLT
jgi:hypothetical protein